MAQKTDNSNKTKTSKTKNKTEFHNQNKPAGGKHKAKRTKYRMNYIKLYLHCKYLLIMFCS